MSGNEYRIFDMSDGGFEGIDEIAELLDVGPDSDGEDGLFICGKSGNLYGFTELIEAHIALMRQHSEGIWFRLTPYQFHDLLNELGFAMICHGASYSGHHPSIAKRLLKNLVAQTGTDLTFDEPEARKEVVSDDLDQPGDLDQPDFQTWREWWRVALIERSVFIASAVGIWAATILIAMALGVIVARGGL